MIASSYEKRGGFPMGNAWSDQVKLLNRNLSELTKTVKPNSDEILN
jgi:hypothetical protein